MQFSIKAKLDSAGVAIQGITESIAKSLYLAAANLARMTLNKAQELAGQKLHNTRLDYINALHMEETAPGIFVVYLDPKMNWVEDGTPQYNMLPKLAQGPKSKVAKDGCVVNPKAKVFTLDGYKYIKNITDNDWVMTHSGKFRKVKELLVRPFGIGQEYVTIKYKIGHEKRDDTMYATLSLTPEHPVLTPNGWVEVQKLKKNDLIACLSDITQVCLECSESLPYKARRFCLNRTCACRYHAKKTIFLKESRLRADEGRRKLHDERRSHGYQYPANFGARDPKMMQRLIESLQKALGEKLKTGAWMPEELLAKHFKTCLWYSDWKENCGEDINEDLWIRQYPLVTDILENGPYKDHKRNKRFYLDFFNPFYKIAVELDGKHWHFKPIQIERDRLKAIYCKENNIQLIRFDSEKAYTDKGLYIYNEINKLIKNHKNEWGTSFVPIVRIERRTVNRKDHAFSKKYDICLEDEEHSFCCNDIMIHNSRYVVIPLRQSTSSKGSESPKVQDYAADLRNVIKTQKFKTVKDSISPITGKRTTVERLIDSDPSIPKHLRGLTRVREFKQGSGRPSSSAYLTFRTASEKQEASKHWVHPPQKAAAIFKDLERFVDQQLDTIVADIFKKEA